ncbi:odorant-binding protein-like [Cricetulus griseus]|uniref:Odorant-binding protein-like n=1 Tax=Cricetulus griseus TaxID=10029 RepID=A0A9J7JS96_CRIGR|nr:odorant-binding protein-like [Cricetulus griseus]
MAKILLLALAIGLAQALNELEGDWVSIAIAADNVEKIEKQGTMRLYARQITCHEECDKLEITFYVNLNGQCSETTVIGYKQEDGNYRTQYEGENIFKPVVITKDFLIFSIKNVDRDGMETHLLFSLATDFPAARRAMVELRPMSIQAVAAVSWPTSSGSMPPCVGICGRLDKMAERVADILRLLGVENEACWLLKQLLRYMEQRRIGPEALGDCLNQLE